MDKFSFVVLGVIVLLISIVAGLDAAKDTLAHHYDVSVFSNYAPQFWDGNLSWCNKWKDCAPGQEQFFLSSTLLVWMTDGWHLMKFAMNHIWLIFPTIIIMSEVEFSSKFWDKPVVRFFLFYFFLVAVQDSVFTLFYHYIFLK